MLKKYSISATAEAVIITGITSEPFNIDIKSDVTLTPFVEELSKQIDVGNTFEFEDSSVELNDKQKLVADTLRKIIDAYNECLKPESPDADGGAIDTADSIEDHTSDLPF